MECADLSALCQVATSRGHDSPDSTQTIRRQVAVEESGDRSLHSKGKGEHLLAQSSFQPN